MATLILASVGKAVGAGFGGTVGAALGQAAGALAGNLIDNALFGQKNRQVSGRIGHSNIQSAAEGEPIARIYGRVRIAGQMVWATRLREHVTTETIGGKGGQSSQTTRYSYTANFAIALCEGTINNIGRVWADGHPIDLERFNWRLYRGTGDQIIDPLIAASQGAAPAYRGVAYIVFEDFPLTDFGNRIPLFHFEVIRAVDRLEQMIRAVTLIPASGEFVYCTRPLVRLDANGASHSVNRHNLRSRTDWHAAIGDLRALCPNLQTVGIVVAWFGDDLRAEHCLLRPKVEARERNIQGARWSVAGVSRSDAETVSLIEGRPAYGGTPDDQSLIEAIAALTQEGLKVALYPFILMDIPPDNNLPDPYGNSRQNAFPWRGRITVQSPADSAQAAINRFCGQASAADFSDDGQPPTYSGPDEWSYRRFILHYAALARACGGVEAFLIGSEMRALTQYRIQGRNYPFVTALRDLARQARQILGSAVKMTYGADWSEYGHYVPEPGTVHFPLDRLWSSPDIDAIGIDNYLPLSDVREGENDRFKAYDLAYLRANITGGEYYDWYYPNAAARRARGRLTITDGAASKPHIYRAKDLKNWWANHHYERSQNRELSRPTSWQPGSKPIWFTELGTPAVDKGANQPNVFFDPKSAESAVPHFSDGGRDDLQQRRSLEAWLSFYSNDHPEFPRGDNPAASRYVGRMVDPDKIFLWCWDARPYPEFPVLRDIWSDGDNWRIGHWLTGRLASPSLSALCRQIIRDMGLDAGLIEIRDMENIVEGYAIAGPISTRDALAPLLAAFGAVAMDRGTRITIGPGASAQTSFLGKDDIISPDTPSAPLTLSRAATATLADEVHFSAQDSMADFRSYSVSARRQRRSSGNVVHSRLAMTSDREQLLRAASNHLTKIWTEAETVKFALAPHRLDLEVGDIVHFGAASNPNRLSQAPAGRRYRIESIEEKGERRVSARHVATMRMSVRRDSVSYPAIKAVSTIAGRPQVTVFDLPPMPGAESRHSPHAAIYADPWNAGYDVYRRQGQGQGQGQEQGRARFITRIDLAATIGQLTHPLAGAMPARISAAPANVALFHGRLQSVDYASLYGGANAAAIISPGKPVEIIQFKDAQLRSAGNYTLSNLIRGQRGSEAAAASAHPIGAKFVYINSAITRLDLSRDQIGLPFDYIFVPAGAPVNSDDAQTVTYSAKGTSLIPFAPTHPEARRASSSQDLTLSWIPRTRIGGDSWILADDTALEDLRFEIELMGENGAILQRQRIKGPQLTLSAQQQRSLYGAIPQQITVKIYQLSALRGRGYPCEATLNV